MLSYSIVYTRGQRARIVVAMVVTLHMRHIVRGSRPNGKHHFIRILTRCCKISFQLGLHAIQQFHYQHYTLSCVLRVFVFMFAYLVNAKNHSKLLYDHSQKPHVNLEHICVQEEYTVYVVNKTIFAIKVFKEFILYILLCWSF